MSVRPGKEGTCRDCGSIFVHAWNVAEKIWLCRDCWEREGVLG